MRTESAILEQLGKRERTATEIYATHRLSTVRAVDRIIILEKGKLLAEGTHEELLERGNQWYRNFYERQIRVEGQNENS